MGWGLRKKKRKKIKKNGAIGMRGRGGERKEGRKKIKGDNLRI